MKRIIHLLFCCVLTAFEVCGIRLRFPAWVCHVHLAVHVPAPLLAVWIDMLCVGRAVSVPLLAVQLEIKRINAYGANCAVPVPLLEVPVRLDMYCAGFYWRRRSGSAAGGRTMTNYIYISPNSGLG